MMTHAFTALGVDAAYVACDVEAHALGAAIHGLAALGALGANVTLPHKIAAASLCDEIEPSARAIGAVNTLRFDRGQIRGANTDARGAVDALVACGFDPRGTHVVVLGAGGAARAIAVGLVEAGAARVSVRARNSSQAEQIAAIVRRFGADADAHVLPSASNEREGTDRRDSSDHAIASAQLIVQATSAGLAGRDDDRAVIRALDGIRVGAIALDAVYDPRETRWLTAARARGLVPVDGLGMLAAQAARALEIWFGVAVNAEILRQFLDASEHRE
jgi:shikimate dehydrogenase